MALCEKENHAHGTEVYRLLWRMWVSVEVETCFSFKGFKVVFFIQRLDYYICSKSMETT